jgi:hypothetical protein
MGTRFTWVIAALCLACTPKVAVPVAANPSVHLPMGSVAVIAADRACQPVADALVARLWASGAVVDPRADLRLDVELCGEDMQVGVEQQVAVDDPTKVERRTRLLARAHALLVIRQQNTVQAHVIGTGRFSSEAAWDGGGALPARSRHARSEAAADVALDLSQQLLPMPMAVERRVWPKAPEASPRGLTTRAVLAEQRGDLPSAITWAERAHLERPSPRAAAYLVDLQRRRASEAHDAP